MQSIASFNLTSCLLSAKFLSVGSVPLSRAYFGSGSGDIFLDNVVCRGTESSLLQCNINLIGQHDCDHSEDAGVRCEGIYIVHLHVNWLTLKKISIHSQIVINP